VNTPHARLEPESKPGYYRLHLPPVPGLDWRGAPLKLLLAGRLALILVSRWKAPTLRLPVHGTANDAPPRALDLFVNETPTRHVVVPGELGEALLQVLNGNSVPEQYWLLIRSTWKRGKGGP